MNAARDQRRQPRYYFGVVNPSYSSGIAGIGYVGGRPRSAGTTCRAASSVAAHEWGHNWGRNHAPCGGAEQPRPELPLRGRRHGRRTASMWRPPRSSPHICRLMGYCNPEWISDYTYTGVLDYRSANPDVSIGLYPGDAACLLVWGRIENGQPVLEPAFEIVTRPSLPAGGGEYTVEGRAADGSRVFSLPFTPAEIADVPGGGQQFAFAIPLSADRASRLASLRLAGRGREVISTSAAPICRRPARAVAPLAVRRTGDRQRRAPVGCRRASDAARSRRGHRPDHFLRPWRLRRVAAGASRAVGGLLERGAEQRGESGGSVAMKSRNSERPDRRLAWRLSWLVASGRTHARRRPR